MQTNKFFTSAKLATLTAAMALCGAAYASTGTASNTADAAPQGHSVDAKGQHSAHGHKGSHHRKHMRGEMRDAAMWVPGYGPVRKSVVDSLSLKEDQSKLLEKAQAEQTQAKKAGRDAMKSARVARLEQVKSGKIDPRAALTQANEAHKNIYAERSKLNENWLAVWDALDNSQQQKIVAHMNERAEKFAKHAEERKSRKAAPATEKASS